MVMARKVLDREMFLMVRLLTEAQLMRELGVSRPTLRMWRQKGMPYVPLGVRLVRYDLHEVIQWLNDRKTASRANLNEREV
jgi:predicted DNA-binding transcriptional regulator AlpA